MIRSVCQIGGLILVSTTMCGCVVGRPASWAIEAEQVLVCGMAMDQVESITERKLESMPTRPGKPTHFIRTYGLSGTTDLRLRFVDNKLKSVEVTWALPRTTRMASYGKTELCGR